MICANPRHHSSCSTLDKIQISAPIGAWKCNFPAFFVRNNDRSIDRQTWWLHVWTAHLKKHTAFAKIFFEIKALYFYPNDILSSLLTYISLSISIVSFKLFLSLVTRSSFFFYEHLNSMLLRLIISMKN